MKGIIVAGALLLLPTLPAFAQARLDSTVVGVGVVATGNVTLQGTLGQPVIGSTSLGGMTAWQGFWYIPSRRINLAVRDEAAAIGLELRQNIPEPASSHARLDIRIARSGLVRLSIHDALGREVLRAIDGYRESGDQSIDLDLSTLAAGRYIVTLVSGLERRSLVMTVAR